MTVLTQHSVCDDDELDARRRPRTDIVAERPEGDDRWGLDEGPFRDYRRELVATRRSDGRHDVTETTTYRLAIPVWGWLFTWPIRRALTRRQEGFSYWWAPPDRLTAGAATVLGLLCAVQIVDGYLGTVLTQTLSFAADEFGRGNTAQGVVFGVVRFGVLVTLIVSTMADRRGRRPLLLYTGVSSCVLTVLGGLSPNIAVLGGTQLFARGLSTALGIIIAIMAVEEMPTRSRAWAASVLTMSAGLGSGMAVWILPLADVSVRGWRIIYLVAGLGIAVIVWAGRRLPETRRFTDQVEDAAELDAAGRERRMERFALLGISLFLLAMFAAPASGFQNEFLREERGFDGGAISIFTIVTSTPIGLGVLVGGYLAESWGRRPVAAIGLVAAAIGTVLSFIVAGPSMWIAKLAGNIVGAIAVPAMAVYGPELFGTHNRSRANALIVTVGVVGSAVGLVSVGWLSDRWGNLGAPIALMGLGPVLVAGLVLLRFPETAGLDLEELNPEDADGAPA
ncbi:MAG: MFS transporter [Actinomycetota bacterium]